MVMRRMSASRLFLMLLLTYAVIALTCTVAFALLPKAAPDRVNSPPLAVTCSKAKCHDAPPPGANMGSVAVTGIPACYNPGQVYQLTVTVSDPAAVRWGFELGVQYDEGNVNDNSSAGTLAIPAGTPAAIVTSGEPALGQSRMFATHDANATPDGTYPTQANSASWRVDWTAPAGRVTPVCFWYAGVAADNDGGRTGDRTYTGKTCIGPCGATETKHKSWGRVKSYYEK